MDDRHDGEREHLSTGDLAGLTGLSLRSIRYYEEVGLVPAAARTAGGHRQFDRSALDRLLLIMKMKPLDFSLDEMGALLAARDTARDPAATEADRRAARGQLAMFSDLVDQRWEWLQERLTIAEQFRAQLRGELSGPAQPSEPRRGR